MVEMAYLLDPTSNSLGYMKYRIRPVLSTYVENDKNLFVYVLTFLARKKSQIKGDWWQFDLLMGDMVHEPPCFMRVPGDSFLIWSL